jgi:hypothetical protein
LTAAGDVAARDADFLGRNLTPGLPAVLMNSAVNDPHHAMLRVDNSVARRP